MFPDPPRGEGKQKVAWLKNLIFWKVFVVPMLLYRIDIRFLFRGADICFLIPKGGKLNKS